jgi:hypothetical protein
MFKKKTNGGQAKQDAELERYRTLLETPTEFKDGVGWTTVAGIFFCGLIMMPGAIYLGLMTGGDMTSAGTWVTLILFGEIARRAMKPLNKQNLVVLYHAANVMMGGAMLFPGGPMAPLVYRSYLVTSDVVRDSGMSGSFPAWFAPPPGSAAILERNLFHQDFLIPIALIAFIVFIGFIKKYTLGYFLFRLTSDVEKLAFPLAPIAAQGAMALAEEDQEKHPPKSEASEETQPAAKDTGKPPLSRWRIFTIGISIGLIYGFLQVGIPTITGIFLEKPVFLIPQPFLDTTIMTEGVLPATPTGITLDLGILILGFVLPFWAVVGTFIAIVITMIANPFLQSSGILSRWQPGMDTVNTTFSNSIDFWMSFGIGTGIGIAIVSIFSTVRSLRSRLKESKAASGSEARENVWAVPEGRGDYPLWLALVGYVVAAGLMIYVVHHLVPSFPIIFLILFSFVYSPFISYVNARLLGIAGQTVEIPFVREGAFILSGAKGVDIWLAPIPIENHGQLAQAFRVNELTGVKFWSLFKAEIIALPILLVLSLLFWAFIWSSGPVPSEAFPTAALRWELLAKTQTLLYSSTFVPPGQDASTHSIVDSEFMQAIHPTAMAGGLGLSVVLFAVLSGFGLPVMLVYGMVRGFGDLPHGMILEIIGAMIGRYYFQKKFGEKTFLRMAPTILAGYFTGVGLIAMATIAIKLIQQAVSSTPF